jgi:hypothetical protein
VILYRCFAWNRRARPDAEDGALWIPRSFQGDGRHDNPDVYGCLYLADQEVSGVVEQLARFRGQRLLPSLLRRRGLPLALAELELADGAEIVDLDEPRTLTRERLRPSQVATRRREVTQPSARTLWQRHESAAGIRWWSTFEALWGNVTLFDRALPSLTVRSIRELTLEDPAVVQAAELFAFRIG